MVQEDRVYQPVVDDDIGALDVFQGLDGDEARVSGASADQCHQPDAAHDTTPASRGFCASGLEPFGEKYSQTFGVFRASVDGISHQLVGLGVAY